MECGIALAVLSSVGVLVAQLATWSLAERARTDARLAALEVATNLLEEARAIPWDELTPEWAAAQRLPDYLSARWPNGRLTVRVEPERTRVKRVTVTVHWNGDRPTAPPVTLVALFAARLSGGAP